MNNEEKQPTKLEQLLELPKLSDISENLLDVASVDSMIKKNQDFYLKYFLEAKEELGLAKENIEDFLEYPEEIRNKAIEHAQGALYDEQYFERHKIDKELILPIQIASVIVSKKTEAIQKNWKVDYYAKLISRLFNIRRSVGFSKRTKKRSLLERIFNIQEVDDHGHII